VSSNRRVLFGVSDVITANYFLKEFITDTIEQGFDVTWFAGGTTTPAPELASRFVHIPTLRRTISVKDDAAALRTLIGLMRRERPMAAHISTPKAALLGMLAAKLCRVPKRVYLVRGLRLETASGPGRWLLWFLEWLTGACATDIVCVSHSVADACAAMRLAPKRKLVVLGQGSSCGVQTERFAPTEERQAVGRELRRSLGIDDGRVVIGYVGRFNKPKGVEELLLAFDQLRAEHNVELMCVGDLDAGEPISAEAEAVLRGGDHVHWVPYANDPSPIYHAFDIFVLPTHREGFPNVCLEAASAGLPVITTDATGAIDSVVPGVTGLIVPCHDPKALAAAIAELVEAPATRRSMGLAGLERCEKEFERETVVVQHVDHLVGHVGGRG
jgi:glycosyltransferase involved in cell wall biosynthesis